MTRVSDLDLERFLVDDLDDDERARVAAAIAADPGLAAHVAARRDEQRAFFARKPAPPALAPARAAVDDDDAPASAWWATRARALRRALFAIPALGGAVAVIAVIGVVSVREPTIGVRGEGLVARLVVRRDAQVFAHRGEPLRKGDAVRVEVDLSKRALCSVVGVDARGVAAVHYDNVALGAAASSGGSAVFPDALVLDDAVGAEDLIVVCAEGAVDVDALVAAGGIDVDAVARAAPGARVAVLSFLKEPPAR